MAACTYCEAPPLASWPTEDRICAACSKAGKVLILLANEIKNDESTSNNQPSSSDFVKGFVKALKLMEDMNRELKLNREELLNEKIAYFSGFANAFKDKIHTDILLTPGDNEPPIPVHRALLATRSAIFRNMLDSDKCKAPANQTITLPELNHEELEALLEFLYSGSLPKEKMKKHVVSLAMAADKYEIPFLQKFCEEEMLGSLNSSNALDTLEISHTCSNQNLKEKVLSFIVRNLDDILFAPIFDAFALKNPHLVTQITRESFTASKKRKSDVLV